MVTGAPRCESLAEICDTPRCKARDIDCSGCSREDGQHVIFEELEELKRNTEYPVGKVLAFEGKAVEVVDGNKLYWDCTGCVFSNRINCDGVFCTPCERTDDGYVKFIERVTEK